MNALVDGLPLLTSQKYFPTTISPSTLFICHVFCQLYLMREEWCSTQAISEAWPHGRVGGAQLVALCFVNFRDFCDSAQYGVVRAGLS